MRAPIKGDLVQGPRPLLTDVDKAPLDPVLSLTDRRTVASPAPATATDTAPAPVRKTGQGTGQEMPSSLSPCRVEVWIEVWIPLVSDGRPSASSTRTLTPGWDRSRSQRQTCSSSETVMSG
jgi:hypothetical protein